METEYKGYQIKIEQDTYIDNPREMFDTFGTMVCFHRRYSLGDKHDLCASEAKAFFTKIEKEGGIVLPLYLLDHSGITMRTTSFNDPWDSGQVGCIYAERSTILKEYNVKKISKKLREKVTKYLEGEVETYDRYLTGEVYYYTIEKDGEIVHSCGGFYDETDYVLNEAKRIVDATENQTFLKRLNRLKQFIKAHVPLNVRQAEFYPQ
jgi:hypothetical protein